MRYYLGPWELDSGLQPPELPAPFWRPPLGVVGAIDLRSLPAHNSPGVGFFTTPDSVRLGNDYRPIGQGDLRSLTITTALRRAIENQMGIQVDGVSLMNCLWDILTLKSDPTGQTRWKPLMPTLAGKLEIHLGGHSLLARKDFDLAMLEAVNVIAVIQEDYRKIRALALEGKTSDPELHRRVLDKLGEKYRVANPEDYFIPADLPKEMRLKHSTTITESFNKADSTILGPDLSWTEVLNAMEVVTNQVIGATGGASNYSRADSDLAGDDHYAQLVCSTLGAGAGTLEVAARFSSSADTAYYAQWLNGSTTYRSIKRVAGSNTTIGTDTTSASITTNDVLKIQSDGSTITRYKNGLLQNTATDTAITGNLRGGIGLFGHTNFYGDSFEASDLAAGGATNPGWYGSHGGWW